MSATAPLTPPRTSLWPLPRWIPAAVCVLLLLASVGSEVLRRRFVADHRQSVPDPLRPRPDSFYRVAWEAVNVPQQAAAGSTVTLLVTLRNIGSDFWPDRQLADPERAMGPGAVRLSYRWWRGDAEVLVSEYRSRQDLLLPLRPDEGATMPLDVDLPSSPGRYRLQIDLVHEQICWFESRGADRLIVPLTVGWK